MGRVLTSTPLVCGHSFRAEVRPQAGERVWCHPCVDYRHVGRRRPEPDTGPARPRKPKRSAVKRECASTRKRTRQVCSVCWLEIPMTGVCGGCRTR